MSLPPIDVSNAGALLALRLDNIGDVLMLAPALRALRAAAPSARLTLCCSPAGALAAPLLPWIDDVLVRRVAWQDVSGALPVDPARELDLVAAIAAGSYDAAFCFTSFAQSPLPPAYACYLAGVPVRAGSGKEFGGSLLTHAVPALPDAAHQAERNLDLLAACGVPPAGDHLQVAVPDEARTGLARLLAAAGVDPSRPFALVAPGASCATRRYPPARFAEACALLANELPAVVTGSARDRDLLGGFDDVPGVASLMGRTSLPELAAAIELAAVVVANNSAPLHLADALGTPSVILYSGAELESQWAPRRAPSRLLRRPTPCAPCYAFECPYALECLDIPPAEVRDAAVRLLSRAPLRETR